MLDFLKSLKIDRWYMVFIVLGNLLLFYSIFFPTYGLSNQQSILLALGMLLVGLGEWQNHITDSWIQRSYIVKQIRREPNETGNLLKGVGIIVLFIFALNMLSLI